MTGAAREGSAHRGWGARRKASLAAPRGLIETPETGHGEERAAYTGEALAPCVLERALRRALVRNLCMFAKSATICTHFCQITICS
jgi:hypothetical protein